MTPSKTATDDEARSNYNSGRMDDDRHGKLPPLQNADADSDDESDSSFQSANDSGGGSQSKSDTSASATESTAPTGTELNDDASSLSSIPLKDLKRVMKERKKQDHKSMPKHEEGQVATNTSSIFSTRSNLENDGVLKGQPDGTSKSKNGASTSESQSENDEEEEAACCLCHCGVDYSDRALFHKKDRKQELEEDEDYYFALDDPYLPEELFDRHNALVYCDSCDRLYHQKCHFVPVLVLPRGDWNCLICSFQKQTQRDQSKAAGDLSRPSANFSSQKLCASLFKSPPNLAARSLEKEWELASREAKARLWRQQFKQLHTSLKSQASNIRLASTALETLTGTKRNRAHFTTSGKKSQELAQTLVRLTTAKWKIREALYSLEEIRVSGDYFHKQLIEWTDQHSNHAQHIFPHGSKLHQANRRTVPRTREIVNSPALPTSMEVHSNNQVPTEINVPSPQNEKRTKSVPISVPEVSTEGIHNGNSNELKPKDDDDSGFSLDDLQCCICQVGDATDENDVLLCDGQGCCRAYHMKCVYPQVEMKEIEDEDEDWFCPLCSAISHFIAEVQLACMDEDWEHRRQTERYQHLENSSLHSWGKVQEVFPEAEWEYSTSLKLNAGKRNNDTAELLQRYLGEDSGGQGQQVQMPVGSDSEDENDYSLFDEESFDERKRRQRQEDMEENSSQSTRSSQATLVEMSSVELNIGRNELDALSHGSDGSMDGSLDSESTSSGAQQRRSRRLRMTTVKSEQSSFADVGAEFDESNIIEGKRQRKKVDYRRLNDALFGDLSAKERAEIDDKDDFRVTDGQETKGRKRPRS